MPGVGRQRNGSFSSQDRGKRTHTLSNLAQLLPTDCCSSSTDAERPDLTILLIPIGGQLRRSQDALRSCHRLKRRSTSSQSVRSEFATRVRDTADSGELG